MDRIGKDLNEEVRNLLLKNSKMFRDTTEMTESEKRRQFHN